MDRNDKDWETHSLRYVVRAIDSAQKHQQKLWAAIAATRTRDGLIAIDWSLIDEFTESCRRGSSLMTDLETVAREYQEKTGAGTRRVAKKTASKTAAKKTAGRKAAAKKPPKKKAKRR